MNRTIELRNKKWVVMAGREGQWLFVHVFQGENKQNEIIGIDGRGIRITRELSEFNLIPQAARELVYEVMAWFSAAVHAGNSYPSLDAHTIGLLISGLGFESGDIRMIYSNVV